MKKLLIRFAAIVGILVLLILVNILIKYGVNVYDPCRTLINYEVIEYNQNTNGDLIVFNITLRNEAESIDGFIYSVVNEDEKGIGLTTVDEPLLAQKTKEYSYSFSKEKLENKSIKKIKIFPILEKYDLRCLEHEKEVIYE